MKATVLALSVVAAMVTMSGVSFGQSTGFALNRFDPSDRGSDWFSTDSLDLRGSNRLGIGVVGDWAYKPLVLYDANNEETLPLVEHQVFAHIGISYIVIDRLRFAVNVPIMALNKGNSEPSVAFDLSEGAGIGDVRLGVDLRLLGEYGDAFTAALGVQVHLPSGKRSAFAGDGKPRVVPRLMIAGNAAGFVYSARIGTNIRTQTESFQGEPFGTELAFGAAAGASLADNKLVIGPEIYGTTVLKDGAAFERKSTPFEVIGGGHYKVSDSWRIGLGVGPGLTRGFGAPTLRVLASLEYYGSIDEPQAPPPPPPEPSDRDGDGILDADDACPDDPGPPNEDPRKHGCPLPADRDGDGIPDSEDACPDDPGPANEDPKKHGCPLPPDRDGDGIPDAEDACPDEAGPPNEDPKKHGCPPPKDRDGDGITDDVDACPDDPGEPNSDPKKHGCPKAIVTEKEIRIMERVEFDTGKATIRPESHAVLYAVIDILQKHPEITKLRVEGHTDNRGGAALNLDLSKRRAASVMTWMMLRGIDANRLTSQGYGQTKPIDANDTDAGRQNNRRVEFQIVEKGPAQ